METLYLIIVAVLLLLSVFASKISDKFGVPALLLFLILGIVAGSEGVGGIYFDNTAVAQTVSIIALVLILFSGGLQTRWNEVKPVMLPSFSLATVGVVLTALIVGLSAHLLLDIPLLNGLLFGSMISSTDAAAVFSVLRSKGVSLKGKLKPLLELESGSNDPMAVFLTIGIIQLLTLPERTLIQIVLLFFQQMVIGGLMGYLMGRLVALVINRIKLGYDGLYPVLTLASVLLTYGVTYLLNGSGFLAVYLMGIVLNHVDIIHKRTVQRFHDGIAWLMQITMFLVLGLFLFPSQLVPVAGVSLLLAGILILIARPLGVFLTLLPFRISFREKLFISWVGLRGAAPIILATFPLMAGISQSNLYFNVIFFIVLTSVLLQGTTLPIMARWLGLTKPMQAKTVYPIEYQPVAGMTSDLIEIVVPPESKIINKAIVELHLPDDLLIILIKRSDEFIVPYGGTIIKENDTLLVLSDEKSLDSIDERFKLKYEHFDT